MLWILIALVSMTSSFPLISSIIFASTKTPPLLLSRFSDLPSVHIKYMATFPEIIEKLSLLEFQLMIDLTLDTSLYALFDRVSAYYNTIYLSISNPSEFSFSSWRVNVHGSYHAQATAISDLLTYLQWKDIALLSSTSRENLLIADSIFKISSEQIETYLKYSPSASQETADNLVGRMIKVKGIQKAVILDEGESLKVIGNGFENKKLLKAGNGIILGSKAIVNNNFENSLIVVEAGLDCSSTLEDYEFQAINQTFIEILDELNSLGISEVDKGLLTQIIKQKYPKGTSSTSYSVVNIQNSQKVLVGSISNTTNITGIIYFPGNTTVSTSTGKAAITISIANGTHEIYDLYTYEGFAYIYEGANYAIMRSNAYNDIPNFYLQAFPTDCGISLYDPYYYDTCYSPIKNDLGVAYVSYFDECPSYGAVETLRQLNVSIPQISPFAQGDTLDNSTAFPEFLKLTLPTLQYIINSQVYIKSLGWDAVVILATDDAGSMMQYMLALEFAAQGTTILNPTDKQVLPSNYTREDFEKYRSYFQAAKDTRCRYFIITAIDRGLILEGLYDIGLRRGDFVYITDPSVLSVLSGVEEKYLIKRQELLLDCFAVTYMEFVGDLGATLKAELSAIFPSTTYMCLSYDTISVIKEAIIFTIAKGEDFEDPDTMKRAMRNNKLIGCLGTVFFGQGVNYRSSAPFLMMQIRNANGTWNLVPVITLDIYSSQIVTVLTPPEWSSGNTTVPSLYRPFNPCPFDAFEIIEASKAKGVLYALSALFVIVACISTCVRYRYSSRDYKLLTKKQIISFADMVYASYFAFQFFQLLSEGPDQEPYKYIVGDFQILISLDFNLYYNLQFENFWRLFYFVFSCTVFWIVLCIITIFKCELTFEDNFLCGRLQLLIDYVVPILGHIGFMPFFSMLMSIFMCNNAIGDSITDAFFDGDCTISCYTGQHQVLVVLTSICIVFFLILVIYCRPLWESSQSSLHLATSPLYLCFLTIFQVIIVVLNKTLKIYHQVVHGYTVSGIIIAFIALTIVMRPYNYARSYAWQLISLVLALWAILICTVFRYSEDILLWSLVEFIGLIAILILGLIVVSKCPPMIASSKGADISLLFLFQFCKDYNKYSKRASVLDFGKRECIYEIK